MSTTDEDARTESSDRAKSAIATIEFSRQTHVEWRDWLRAHPDDKRGEVTGDADYHEKTITEYDNVLDALRITPQPVRVEVTDEMVEALLKHRVIVGDAWTNRRCSCGWCPMGWTDRKHAEHIVAVALGGDHE